MSLVRRQSFCVQVFVVSPRFAHRGSSVGDSKISISSDTSHSEFLTYALQVSTATTRPVDHFPTVLIG